MKNWQRPFWLLSIICSILTGLALGQEVLANSPHQTTLPQTNSITSPKSDSVTAGIVLIQGTATHPDFLRYEIALYKEFDPYAGWIVFADGSQPVISGTLAVWDTTIGRSANAPAFSDGLYRLRLRVVKRDYNYDEYFTTNVLVSNDTATPTPTITATTAAEAETTPTPNLDIVATPTLNALPSLTPFPTPSAIPLATTSGPISVVQSAPPDSDPVRDLVSQTQNLDTTPFVDAIGRGAQWAMYGFATLAIYLILRTIGRWLWLKVIRKDK